MCSAKEAIRLLTSSSIKNSRPNRRPTRYIMSGSSSTATLLRPSMLRATIIMVIIIMMNND